MEKCRIVPTRLWSARKRQLINLVSEGQLQAWQLPYFTTNSVSGQPLSIFYEKLHKSAAVFPPVRAETALGGWGGSGASSTRRSGLLIQSDCLVSNFNDIPWAYHYGCLATGFQLGLSFDSHTSDPEKHFFSSLRFWFRLLWNPSPCGVGMGGQRGGRTRPGVTGGLEAPGHTSRPGNKAARSPSWQTQIPFRKSKFGLPFVAWVSF